MHLEDTPHKIRITTDAFIICNDEILLFQRSFDSKVFPGFWTVPGGHIDTDEDILSSCIREIREETGLEVSTNEVKLKFIALHNHLDRDEIWHIFGFLVLVKNKQEIINSLEGSAKWVPLHNLKAIEIFPPVAYYLDHVLKDSSELLYNFSNWKSANLVKVVNETTDKDY